MRRHTDHAERAQHGHDVPEKGSTSGEHWLRRPLPAASRFGALRALTDRKVDVLRCLGRGLSNNEIADELFLSEATLKTHVGRILSKCGLRDRVQAVVLAYDSGLIQPGETS